MRVRLLDFTGAGQMNPADYAAKLLIYTKNTRLTQGEETQTMINKMSSEEIEKQLYAIMMTVRSSWEFVDYTFEVCGVTRAYTHQAVRTRTASYAQQAMRVTDMSNFETSMPESVKQLGKEQLWKLCMGVIAETYKELRQADVPAQDARGVLPTNVLTNIIIKMNLRTLADVIGKRMNARAQDEYETVVSKMEQCVLTVHPWTKQFLHPPRTRTPATDAILKEALNGKAPVEVPRVNDALKEQDSLKSIWG